MEVILLKEPFEHVIIKNFYTPEELIDIKNELKFLTKPHKMLSPGDPGASHGQGGGTTHKAICLEEVYNNKKISDIITIFKKKYDKELVNLIVSKFPSYEKLKYINSRITKVRYYFDGEGYAPHTDINRDFIAFSYFHSVPKKFSGGELHCTDFNYTLDCSDNTFILLPSYIKHEVTVVNIIGEEYYSGNGRYCVSQFLNLIPSLFDTKTT